MTEPLKPARPPISLSYQAHRIVIGVLGLLLPILLWVWSGVFQTADLPHWGVLESVSAYYYSGAMFVFVGVIFALALFLATYRGYAGAIDQVLGILGGIAAMLVVIFPTNAPDGIPARSWWVAWMGDVHLYAASALFGIFIIFALFVFTQSDKQRADQPTEKKVRNALSIICGIMMLVGVVVTAIRGHAKQTIFWPECWTIFWFAVSWLIKALGPYFARRALQ